MSSKADIEEITRQLKRCGYGPEKEIVPQSDIDEKDGKSLLFKVVKETSHNVYFAKMFPPVNERTPQNLIEIDCLMRLNHPNIIHGIDLLTRPKCSINRVTITMPAERIGLNLFLEEKIPIDDKIPIIYKICHAVKYLHDNDIIHLDIKPENIVLTNREPKLIDFGLAEFAGDDGIRLQAEKITPIYRPPEYDNRYSWGTYYKSDDVWALGVTIAEFLLSELHIFYNLLSVKDENRRTKAMALREEILVRLADLTEGNKISHLIRLMLSNDRRTRSTMKEVLADPLFDGFRVDITSSILHSPMKRYEANDTLVVKEIVKSYRYMALTIKNRTSFPSVRSLFLAVSLFSKFNASYAMFSVNEMAFTCIYMSEKISGRNYEIDHLSRLTEIDIMKEEVIPNIESRLISMTNGILYDDQLYNICVNAAQLKMSFETLIEHFDVYLETDLNIWKRTMDRQVGSIPDDKEKLTIRSLV